MKMTPAQFLALEEWVNAAGRAAVIAATTDPEDWEQIEWEREQVYAARMNALKELCGDI